MTVPLYLEDAYRRDFDSTVIETYENAGVLAESLFYPGGVGHLRDSGWLDADGQTWEVVTVRKRDDKLWHELDKPAPPVGTRVHGRLDWSFRYKMMRTHTALHILCGIVWREFDSQVTGTQMYSDRARMDFTLEDLGKDRVALIEQKVNEAVEQGYPVEIKTLPREEAFQIPDLIRTKINLLPEGIDQVRVVDIVGLDLQADGGTHVRNTKEVGRVRIIRTENKGKHFKRLEIALDPNPSN